MSQNPTSQFAVHVVPKSSRSRVDGVRLDDAGECEVIVRVTAPPEDGKANKAVCQIVAKALGIAKSKVRVARGETSRHKMLAVDAQPYVLESWIAGLPRV